MRALILAQTQSDPGLLSYLIPLVAAVTGIAVGWIARTATLGASKINAKVEREKLAHEHDKHYAERRDKAEQDFRAASEAMEMVRLEEVSLVTRRSRAREARRRLLSVSWTLGKPMGGSDLEDLISALENPDREAVQRAIALWPSVERAIRTNPPPRPEAPS